MGTTRRTFLTMLGVSGAGALTLGFWARHGNEQKAAEAAKIQAKAEADKLAALNEMKLKNLAVQDPVYSLDAIKITEVKDEETGLMRPVVVNDTSGVVAELTGAQADKPDGNKVFMVANSKDQTIKPKGGNNNIMLMPPVRFGKKTIDGSGGAIESFNELNIDYRILAYYPGTSVQRDGDDLIIKFLKDKKAPDAETPSLTVKNQFAGGTNKGVIRRIGIIQPDGAVQAMSLSDVKRATEWEKSIKAAITTATDFLSATVNKKDEQDRNVGTLEEMIAKYNKEIGEILSAIAAAKKGTVAQSLPKDSNERRLQEKFNEMKPALQAKIDEDAKAMKDTAGIAYGKMVEDIKRFVSEPEAAKPSPTAVR